jgi:hypothetical protein
VDPDRGRRIECLQEVPDRSHEIRSAVDLDPFDPEAPGPCRRPLGGQAEQPDAVVQALLPCDALERLLGPCIERAQVSAHRPGRDAGVAKVLQRGDECPGYAGLPLQRARESVDVGGAARDQALHRRVVEDRPEGRVRLTRTPLRQGAKRHEVSAKDEPFG